METEPITSNGAKKLLSIFSSEGGRPRLRLETGSMSEALGQGDRWRANPPRQRHSRAHPVVVDVSVFCVRARAARRGRCCCRLRGRLARERHRERGRHLVAAHEHDLRAGRPRHLARVLEAPDLGELGARRHLGAVEDGDVAHEARGEQLVPRAARPGPGPSPAGRDVRVRQPAGRARLQPALQALGRGEGVATGPRAPCRRHGRCGLPGPALCLLTTGVKARRWLSRPHHASSGVSG